MKRWLAFIVIVAGCSLGTAWILRTQIRDAWDSLHRPSVPTATSYVTQASSTTAPQQPANLPTRQRDPLAWSGALPAKVNLAVPFLAQAPKGDWSLPYEEACEEASSIMVDAYYKGRTVKFSPDEGDKAILDLVAFEKKLLGLYEDTSATTTARFIREYFKYKTVLVRELDPSVIKSSLAHGYPVIVPAYGKALGNPNYRNGGPVYHMLVVKGYLEDGRWITNDAGTRRGADYIYAPEVLLNAAHDWNNGDVIHGKPLMIVVIPNNQNQ
jgi:hypothetical protein